jgi:hypothetical protein
LQTTLLAVLIVPAVAITIDAQAPVSSPMPTPTPVTISTPTPEPTSKGMAEADPTRPLLIQIRNEYRDLKNGAWANTVLFRHDRFMFRNLGVKGGAKGLILRFDMPLNIVHSGTTTKAGLGDIYTQVLYAPRISRRFVFTLGSGVLLPTATDTMLGSGKFVIAPLVVPLWYLAKRKRLVTMRFQHYVSVAGNGSRPNINYTVVDPIVGWSIARRSWVFTNTEFKWDWRTKLGSATTGVQVGHMISGNMGIWIKPEIPWGPGRTGGFNIKAGVVLFR